MSDESWKALEDVVPSDEAARKIGEAMTLLNQRRWGKATQKQKDKQGALMRAGRKRKAKRGKK